jgi:hypothetical protein
LGRRFIKLTLLLVVLVLDFRLLDSRPGSGGTSRNGSGGVGSGRIGSDWWMRAWTSKSFLASGRSLLLDRVDEDLLPAETLLVFLSPLSLRFFSFFLKVPRRKRSIFVQVLFKFAKVEKTSLRKLKKFVAIFRFNKQRYSEKLTPKVMRRK